MEEERGMRRTGSLNILVVDDEEDICRMFEKWLTLEGHRIEAALTGREALNLVKKKDFQIVFLNILIPEIRGIVVLEKIKEISPETKVFMMTGKLIDKNLAEDLKRKGASGSLQKPFTIEDIQNILSQLA
jgi:DNA-binding NtrC family response regulator